MAFVEQQLSKRLRPRDIVVMDNLRAHKNSEVLDRIHSAGASALFLPPYSPEWNPIERAWSKMKEMFADSRHSLATPSTKPSLRP
ncbi:MAG: transposase [Myxococcota bacterium]